MRSDVNALVPVRHSAMVSAKPLACTCAFVMTATRHVARVHLVQHIKMSWVFASQDAAGQDTSTYEARMGSRMQLIASPDSTGISVLPTPPHDESSVLGIAGELS